MLWAVPYPIWGSWILIHIQAFILSIRIQVAFKLYRDVCLPRVHRWTRMNKWSLTMSMAAVNPSYCLYGMPNMYCCSWSMFFSWWAPVNRSFAKLLKSVCGSVTILWGVYTKGKSKHDHVTKGKPEEYALCKVVNHRVDGMLLFRGGSR